jgi:hypothetical protein
VRNLEISLQFRGIKSFQRVLYYEIIAWSLAKTFSMDKDIQERGG